MSQFLIIKNGISLSYAEYGRPDGYPILAQHGLIASIKDGDLFEGLTKAGARVICIARPGYGDSSPYEMTNIGEWGELVSEMVKELQLTRFDVLGMSSGAPYSYAIGWALPEAVRNIYIFSGIPAMYDDAALAHWPFSVQKNASLAEMKKLAGELFFSNLSTEDLARNDVQDSMAHDGFGIALDFRLRCMDWGFQMAEVKQKVIIRHARFDGNVPLTTVEKTVALLQNGVLNVEENEVHFSPETLDAFFESEIIPRMPGRE
jgi:pimeloyl-ACP methyl ester carboxylesterase